jgi:cyclopropane fatty-acyl-phospholipid synthase-like methyltransferase
MGICRLRKGALTSSARFEQTFTGPASAVRARIWQQVYGPEYPSWADPFSYVSVTELRRFARELHAAHGQCLVDAGCGRGGPGLWMAAVTGTRLIGIDLDEAALAAARRRADQAGMADRASFRRGSFHDTRLPDGSAQAVMSIDALLFAPSKPAAAAELARILVPGGRLVMTSWDYHSQPAGRPAQIADHRPLLNQAGFDVLCYEETCAWRDRQQRTGQALLAAAAELAAEDGGTAAQRRARITEMNATLASITRRVLVIAQRRPTTPGRQPDQNTRICPG